MSVKQLLVISFKAEILLFNFTRIVETLTQNREIELRYLFIHANSKTFF